MDEDILNPEKTDNENDFEAQLAELIKQSGGVVPPKKPKPAEQESGSRNASEQQPVQNQDEQQTQTMGTDTVVAPPAADEMPVFDDIPSIDDEPIIIAAAPATEENTVLQTQSDTTFEEPAQKVKTPEEIEAEIDALIAGMEKKTEETISDTESIKTDEAAVDDTALSDIESEIADLERTINETEIASLERKLSEQTRAAEEERGLAAESYRLDYELERMLDSLKSDAEVPPPAERAEKADIIENDKIEIVPKSQPVASTDTPTPKPDESQKDTASVSELEQMRARIASLEYMLAQKPQSEQNVSPSTPPPVQEHVRTAPPEPHVGGGDINSMFKQWFDLEMASKMKNLITEDEKKKGAETEKVSAYEQGSYDGESTSSDFVKLSDNVYYNVKEKKTYVMKELTASPPLPAIEGARRPVKKKIIKRKPAPKKKPSRLKRRAALHNRALHPRRPRRRPQGLPPRRP